MRIYEKLNLIYFLHSSPASAHTETCNEIVHRLKPFMQSPKTADESRGAGGVNLRFKELLV